MDSICRLCCSTKFVNNNLFDEENALYLKMELFLPIKIMKGDKLPQKVCNRCSCKVNDIYQFCNFAIEAQDRIRRMFLETNNSYDQSIDLSLTKQKSLGMIAPSQIKTEQGTQTENATKLTEAALVDTANEPLKIEPSISPMHIKTECSVEFDDCHDIHSDSSDDLSLVLLKERKNHKSNTNGETQPKKTRKKKPKQPTNKDNVVDKFEKSVTIDIVAQEVDPTDDLGVTVDIKKIKNELDEEKEQIQCCICFNLFYCRSTMLQHYRQHVSEAESMEPPAPPPFPDAQPPKCPRCRKVVEAGAWAGHWARHWERDRRPYRCALCEKTFRNPQQILNHGKTHKAGEAEPVKKRFVCDLCPEGFVYMRYLLSHRSRAHPEAAGRALSLRCAVCARAFAHLNSLRRHLRAHTGERNFLCSVCGKALSSREHLKFHLRIHTGYKPNVCKTCGKGFVKKCNLTLHERVHSGEKPHVCSHCGKAFSQRSTLVIHERYHSGARPYACALCGRGFVAKGLLSMHLKTTCI